MTATTCLPRTPVVTGALALLVTAIVIAGPGPARGGTYQVDWRAQLEDWRFPAGMIELDRDAGSIRLASFRGRYNAARDADAFSHALVDQSLRSGGVDPDKVGSNPSTGRRVADGRRDTYWQPAAGDRLEDWWIEVDLGRATAVTDIRLVFPDRPGARPFQEFTIFGSEGRRTGSRQDVHFFHIIGGTTRPNADTLVVFDVKPTVAELVRALPDTAASSLEEYEKTYDVLQYIRFVADRQTVDAGLAEIEIYTPGENIALSTLDRLGSIVDVKQPGAKPAPTTMADGSMNDMWGTAFAGAVWEWDLGGLFWVRRVIMRASSWEQRVRWYGSLFVQIMPHALRVSDGAETLTGEIDYDLLFATDRDAFGQTQSNMPMQLDYRFAPRRLRYLQADWEGSMQTGWIGETIIIPGGHAAEVTMISELIDLTRVAGGTRSKVIETLRWETDPLDRGAYVRARTRSGATVVDSALYFHQDGRQIDETLYNRLPGSLQGEKLTYQVPGPDWSGWSNWYTIAGTGFLSPSPRQYAQIMLVLGSERHDTTPVVHSVSLDYVDAVLTDIKGALWPREVPPGTDTLFTYRLQPESRTSAERFNHILVRTPSAARVEDVALRIDGETRPLGSFTVETRAPDSLIVRHEPLRNEPVELDFRARVLGNATEVLAFVGLSDSDDLPPLWQPVNATENYATMVLVPTVASASRYLTGLSVTPVFSPNGDGVGDQALVRFAVLRAELLPAGEVTELVRVDIHDLSGRRLAELQGEPQGDLNLLYTWSGRDASGRRVAPGSYICRVQVKAEAGGDEAVRVISVAY